ncbi:peptidase [Oceanobacillus halophilus]|uniref:Peptidase n=1 Tax=Oceanobacillus halophilus TaxID=930130 RepID=A0A494ZQK5_9BACI|nr:peptidase [Oceanobacillus halophilus]RKQ27559.1 peptidase [Oceanobacillus halophilus]
MKITLQSTVSLHSLSIRPDKKHYIVEDEQSGNYYEMPKVCIDAIEMMQEGKTLGEMEDILVIRYPEEDVELISFTEQLIDFGLVKELDGQILTREKQTQSPAGLEWIPQWLGKFFFNGLTNKVYGLIFLANILFFIWKPHLLPNYGDIFLFDSMMMNMVTYMIISLILILIHESGHILAIRAHGLPTKLNIGNRLFLVVFETDLTTAWKLSPKQRNQLYLAGMSFEQVILFLALSISFFSAGSNSLLAGIISLIIFDIFIKFIYQCCFYMKTDLYYVVENSTGCYNLMESSQQLLSKWIPLRKQDRRNKEAIFEKSEVTIIRFYSLFYLLGMMLMAGLLIFYFLPQILFAFSQSLHHLTTYSPATPYFWDGITFITQTIIIASILVYTRLR